MAFMFISESGHFLHIRYISMTRLQFYSRAAFALFCTGLAMAMVGLLVNTVLKATGLGGV